MRYYLTIGVIFDITKNPLNPIPVASFDFCNSKEEVIGMFVTRYPGVSRILCKELDPRIAAVNSEHSVRWTTEADKLLSIKGGCTGDSYKSFYSEIVQVVNKYFPTFPLDYFD